MAQFTTTRDKINLLPMPYSLIWKYNYLAEEFLKLHTFKLVWAEFILVSGAKPSGKNIESRIDKTHVGSVCLSVFPVHTLHGPVNISTEAWSQILI